MAIAQTILTQDLTDEYDNEAAVKSLEQVVCVLLVDGAKDCTLLLGLGIAGGSPFCKAFKAVRERERERDLR
ncbi:unnamed protein product [Prunus armeniaca]|uniref:Uncharacterized protein n=1 Tax=Prunus armeniaca TaxID=36596 RepID=A0A6J5WST3_PRUAR|nr:unnamed protein product [Prunus armeniaca]